MKKLLSLIALSTCLSLPACNRNNPAIENSRDGISDAFDQRPGEGLRDAAEDAADAVKGTGKEIKDAVKKSTR